MANNRSERAAKAKLVEEHLRDVEQAAMGMNGEQKKMLQKAHDLIYGNRQQEYGPAKENFQNIADLWSTILGIPVTPDQVALCMIQVKVARLIRTPDHEDSWVDIAGYVGCKQKMIDGD